MYKMIVTDLDGTLLNENKMVSSNTKNYLKKIKDNGHIVCIDTGRNIERAKYAIVNTDFVNYIIANNGALIFDVENNKWLFKSKIKDIIVKELFLKYINTFDDFEINTVDYIYRYILQNEINVPFVKNITNINDFISKIKDVYNITISFKNESTINTFLEDIKNNYNEIYSFIMQDSFSDKKWITLMNNGVSKFNGIKIVSNYINIDNSEIIAFGDGLNDIDMIKNVGMGVAMKNALKEIKDVAKDITKSDNTNEGVIKYLEDVIK